MNNLKIKVHKRVHKEVSAEELKTLYTVEFRKFVPKKSCPPKR